MTEALTIQVSFDEKSLAALAALTAAMNAAGGTVTEVAQADVITEAEATEAADAAEAEKKAKAKAKREAAAAKKKAEAAAKKAEEAVADDDGFDRETVRARLKEVGATVGQEAALAILTKFGATSMAGLKKEDFAGAMAAADEAIEGAVDPLDD